MQSYGVRKSKALHQHWTWKGGVMKPKTQYKTLDDALKFLLKHEKLKNNYHPYICPDCGMWHIGHNKQHGL